MSLSINISGFRQFLAFFEEFFYFFLYLDILLSAKYRKSEEKKYLITPRVSLDCILEKCAKITLSPDDLLFLKVPWKDICHIHEKQLKLLW